MATQQPSLPSRKEQAHARKLLPTIFHSKIRPEILKVVARSKEPTYISQVARELNVNKRTVLTNLSTLESRGLVKSQWKTIRIKGRPTIVKQFTATRILDDPAVRELLG